MKNYKAGDKIRAFCQSCDVYEDVLFGHNTQSGILDAHCVKCFWPIEVPSYMPDESSPK